MPGLNLQVVRYLVAGAIALVIVALAGIVIVVILRGGPGTSALSLVGLFGFIATLVGLLVNLLGTGAVAQGVQQTRTLVNGHLAQHNALASEVEAAPEPALPGSDPVHNTAGGEQK